MCPAPKKEVVQQFCYKWCRLKHLEYVLGPMPFWLIVLSFWGCCCLGSFSEGFNSYIKVYGEGIVYRLIAISSSMFLVRISAAEVVVTRKGSLGNWFDALNSYDTY
jgi:hypothetical protein